MIRAGNARSTYLKFLEIISHISYFIIGFLFSEKLYVKEEFTYVQQESRGRARC